MLKTDYWSNQKLGLMFFITLIFSIIAKKKIFAYKAWMSYWNKKANYSLALCVAQVKQNPTMAERAADLIQSGLQCLPLVGIL